MQVKMTVTVSFFNALLTELSAMAEYYDRHAVQVVPQQGLPAEIPRLYYMGNVSDKVYAGMQSIKDGNNIVYIRSSGNWIMFDKGTCEVTYSGRRHSLQELLYSCNGMFPQTNICGWQYIETMAPDLAPWETTT